MISTRIKNIVIGTLGALLIAFEFMVIGCESGGIQGTNTGEQQREYTVRIEEKDTEEPIDDVAVTLEANNATFLTDENGEAVVLIPRSVAEIGVVLIFEGTSAGIGFETRVDLDDNLALIETATLVFNVDSEQNKAVLDKVVDPKLQEPDDVGDESPKPNSDDSNTSVKDTDTAPDPIQSPKPGPKPSPHPSSPPPDPAPKPSEQPSSSDSGPDLSPPDTGNPISDDTSSAFALQSSLPIDFGPVTEFEESAEIPIGVLNTGSTSLSLFAKITGAHQSHFSLESASFALQPGQKKNFRVKCRPLTRGNLSANLEIVGSSSDDAELDDNSTVANNSAEPVSSPASSSQGSRTLIKSISLNCQGTSAIQIPEVVAFGSVPDSGTSQTISITNLGSQNEIIVNSVALLPGSDPEFTLLQSDATFPQAIAPSASFGIVANCTPLSRSGPFLGRLIVTFENAPDEEVELSCDASISTVPVL